MIFRQLYDHRSSTYTYLLADGGEAILIDPVFEHARRDAALLRELGLTLRITLETHIHADHVTGGWLLRRKLGSKIGVAAAAGAADPDLALSMGDRVPFGDRRLEVRATPGHTNGCVSFVLDDGSMAFTGDALLIRGAGRTDFQQGDPARLFRSVHEELFTLPDACLLYPAHDYAGRTVTTVAEERGHNPRLGGERSVDDFVGYMSALGLPHPKLLDVAVPANLRLGEPEEGEEPTVPDWAPLELTYAGVHELEPAWLDEHRNDPARRLQIVDVRSPAEFDGELGHIPGAVPIPLPELSARVGELDAAFPVVTVCRSGGRSAQAAVLLGRAQFPRVANLAGGMLRWRAEGRH